MNGEPLSYGHGAPLRLRNESEHGFKRNQLLEWGRMPGDLIFIIGGSLPFLWIAWQGLRFSRRGRTTAELPQDVLFVEKQPVAAGSPTQS